MLGFFGLGRIGTGCQTDSMFTGLVQAVGTLRQTGARLVLDAPNAWTGEPFQHGESIAVNGVCLTLVDQSDGLAFDLSEETLERTTLGSLPAGAQVNLERALRMGDRLGGHIVQGHVDEVGKVTRIEKSGEGWVFGFQCSDGSAKFLADKGSVTVDGISLTVVQPNGSEFSVAVIPHTFSATNLSGLSVGDSVNLEFDVLAKHVDRLMSFRPQLD